MRKKVFILALLIGAMVIGCSSLGHFKGEADWDTTISPLSASSSVS